MLSDSNQNNLNKNNISQNEWLPLSKLAIGTPYSAEYLSLLARKYKLPARKVDNVWYATKASLHEYIRKQGLKSQNVNLDDELLPLSKLALSAPYTAEYLSLLSRKHKFPARKIDHIWHSTKSELDQYIKKQEARARTKDENFPAPAQKNKVFLQNLKERGELLQIKKAIVQNNRARSYQNYSHLLTGEWLDKKASATLTLNKILAATIVFLIFINLSNFLVKQAPLNNLVSASLFSPLESLLDGFNSLRDKAIRKILFTSNPIIKPVNTSINNQKEVQPKKRIEPSIAITQAAASINLDSLKSSLRSELESYIQIQLGLASEPRIVYQSAPALNTTVLRQEILLTDTRPSITRQSDSDSDSRSVAISRLTDGGSFTNSILTSATVSGPAGGFTNLNFTNATGTTLSLTSATSTNFYVSGLASTTDFRSNTGIIGNLTSGFATLTNLLANGSSTLQNFSAQTGTLANLLANGSSTLQNFTFQNATGTAATTTSFALLSLTSTRIPFISTGGALIDSSALTFELANGRLTTTYASTTQLQSSNNAYFATSGGNVGIGTTTPTSLLQVAGSAPKLTLSDTGAGTNLKHWFLESSAGSFSISTTTDALTTSVTRALTINSSSNIGIGTTTPEQLLHISGATETRAKLSSTGGSAGLIFDGEHATNALLYSHRTSGEFRISFDGGSTDKVVFDPSGYVSIVRASGVVSGYNRTGTDGTVLEFSNDGTAVGSVSVDGSTTAYNTTSDRQLKENIEDSVLGLDVLRQVQVRDYNFISDPESRLQGFVAQELYEIYPQAVYAPDEGYWAIDYGKITPLIIKGVQELDLNLNNLAGLATTSTPASESFVSSFLENLFNKVRTWLADASNGIGEIIANTFRAKELICINDTCVNEDQLKALLIQAGGTSSSNSNNSSGEVSFSPLIIEEGTATSTLENISENSPDNILESTESVASSTPETTIEASTPTEATLEVPPTVEPTPTPPPTEPVISAVE